MTTKLKILLLFLLTANALTTYAGACKCYECDCRGCNGCRIEAPKAGLTKSHNAVFYDMATLNLKNPIVQQQKSLANTNTAITIEQADFQAISAPGNTWISFVNGTSTISMNIGAANAITPQTWSLPVNLMTYFDGGAKTDFIRTTDVPSGLLLSNVNMVARTYELDNGEVIQVYNQYNISAGEVTHKGTSYDQSYEVDDAFDEPDFEYSDVPLNVGDNFTSVWLAKDYETNLSLEQYTTQRVVDAFGTITTPEGTFDCLRMTIIFKKETRLNESSPWSQQLLTSQIGFITKEGHYFQANILSQSGNIASLKGFNYKKIVKTNSLSETSDVKLNNNSKGISINQDSGLPHVSAILDIKSDGLGVLIPRIARVNRPTSPATGLLVYQIDQTPGFYYYDGSGWRILGSSASASMATSAVVQTPDGFNTLPTLNSTVSGKSALKEGSSFVKFDGPKDDFENLVIQIQAEGDCSGLFISKKTKEGFEVKELQKGKSNVKFSWKLN